MSIYTSNIKSSSVNEGLTLGLKALVRTLKIYCPDFDTLLNAVRNNEEYINVSEEEVRKYY